MNQELEIEFKNGLTEPEYFTIFEKEFKDSNPEKQMTFQKNYYFDTIEQLLKKQSSALRVRVTNFGNELTFKVPNRGFLLETNYNLHHNEVEQIIQSNQMKLSSYISSTDSIPELEGLTKETIFYLFNQFETKRYEKEIDGHLIVLDQTTFQNGVIDYELEIETQDPKEGHTFFLDFLEKHGVSRRNSLPKIARAEIQRKRVN